MNDKGFTVVAYNRTTSKVDSFLQNEAKGNILSRAPRSPPFNDAYPLQARIAAGVCLSVVDYSEAANGE